MQFVPVEKATTSREASSANFLIDSFDRGTLGKASDFTINSKQSLFNGFFTRLGVSELTLFWSVSNISAAAGNNEFKVQVGSSTPATITLLDGNYTVAAALTVIVFQLNLAALGATFSIVGDQLNGPGASLTANTSFQVLDTTLARQLSFDLTLVSATGHYVLNPFLLPYRYLDFVCDNLTYNQALKDNSTSGKSRDTLYRWNFAWESPAPQDQLGYPINQGYTSFTARRNFAYPKQIRWESNIPIGQLNFQVLTPDSVPVVLSPTVDRMEWGMTLLITEV
jgi:hypothetical protein